MMDEHLINATKQTYGKLFDVTMAGDSTLHTIMAMGYDTETPRLARGKSDKVGSQISIHDQGRYAATSLAFNKYGISHNVPMPFVSEHILVAPTKGLEGRSQFVTKETEAFNKKAGVLWHGPGGEPIFDFEGSDWHTPAGRRVAQTIKKAGGTPSARLQRYIMNVQKKTGLKLMLSQEDAYARVAGNVSGLADSGTMSILLGYNSAFDERVLEGMGNAKGVNFGPNVRRLDMLQMTKVMFPEIATSISKGETGEFSRQGTAVLENLINLAMGKESALQRYGVSKVPTALSAASEFYGLSGGNLISHSGDVDVVHLNVLLEAAFRRAADSDADHQRLVSFLARNGINPLTGADQLDYLKTADPQNVARLMLADRAVKGDSSIFRMGNRDHLRHLHTQLKTKYGAEFLKDFMRAEKALGKAYGSSTGFIMRGDSLVFGAIDKPQSWVALPTQNYDVNTRGIVTLGHKVKGARGIGVISPEGRLTEQTFSRSFYRRLVDRLGDGSINTGSYNTAVSLPDVVSQVMRSQLSGLGGADIALRDILQTYPTHSGMPSVASSLHEGLQLQIASRDPNVFPITVAHDQSRAAGALEESKLAKLFQDLHGTSLDYSDKTAGGLYRQRTALVAGIQDRGAKPAGSKEFQSINLHIAKVEGDIAEELHRLGSNWAYSKAEAIAQAEGGLSIASPLANIFFPLTAEKRGAEKGQHQMYKAGDLSPEHVRNMKNAGRIIGHIMMSSTFAKKGPLSGRLRNTAMQANVLVAQFRDNNAARMLLADSMSLVTSRGANMLRGRTSYGDLTIKNWTLRQANAINTLAGKMVLDPNSLQPMRTLTHKGLVTLGGGTLNSAQLDAVAVLKKAIGNGPGSGLLDQIGSGQAVTLAAALPSETELKLQLYSRGLEKWHGGELLIGPYGQMRTTAGGVLRDIRGTKHESALAIDTMLGGRAGIDMMIAAEDAKSLGNIDLFATHRLSLLSRNKQLRKFVKWANKQEKVKTFAKQRKLGVPALKLDGMSLVAADGINTAFILDLTDKYRAAHKNVARLATVFGDFDGISLRTKLLAEGLSEAAVDNLEDTLGLQKGMSRSFLTEVALRADLTSDVNPFNPMRIRAQQLSMYGAGLAAYGTDPYKDPIFRIMHGKFLGKKGLDVGWATNLAKGRSTQVSRFFGAFKHIGPIRGQSSVVQMIDRKMVLTQVGSNVTDFKVGDVLTTPASTHTRLGSADMQGTYLDPRLRKHGLFLDFGQDVTLQTGPKSWTGRYLNIPGDDVLNLSGENQRLSSGTHKNLIEGLSRYAATGGDVSAEAPWLAPDAAKPRSVRVSRVLGQGLYDILLNMPGKDKWLDDYGTIKMPNSFRGRLIGKAPTVNELKAGKFGRAKLGTTADAMAVLTADISREQLEAMVRRRGGDAVKILDKVDSGRGYLHAVIRVDPAQRPDHFLMMRLRIVKDKRNTAFRNMADRGVLDFGMAPFVFDILERDADKDAINFSIMEGARKDVSPLDLRKEFRARATVLASATKQYYTMLKKGPAAEALDFLSNLDPVVGATLAAYSTNLEFDRREAMQAFLGMKTNVTLGYTVTKQARRLMDMLAYTNSESKITQALLELGYDKNVLGKEFISGLASLEARRIAASKNILQNLLQGGLKKGAEKKQVQDVIGSFMDIRKAVLEGDDAAFKEASSTMVDLFETMLKGEETSPGVFEEALFKPGSALEYASSPRQAAETVGDILPPIIKATALGGGTSMDAMGAVTAHGKTDPEAIAGMFFDTEGTDALSKMFDVDPALGPQDKPSVQRALDEQAKQGIPDTTKASIKEFLKNDKGKLAIMGMLAVGAFFTVKGMFSGGEVAPPEGAPMPSGPPLPPAPMVDQPQDRGIRNAPIMTRPVARVSPMHPTPIPRPGITRTYRNIQSTKPNFSTTNNVDVRMNSAYSTIDMERRLMKIADSDFVR